MSKQEKINSNEVIDIFLSEDSHSLRSWRNRGRNNEYKEEGSSLLGMFINFSINILFLFLNLVINKSHLVPMDEWGGYGTEEWKFMPRMILAILLLTTHLIFIYIFYRHKKYLTLLGFSITFLLCFLIIIFIFLLILLA